MPTQEGHKVGIIFAPQDDFETLAAAGDPAWGIECKPSQGFAKTMAKIESALRRRSRLKTKPRQGSISASFAAETELQVGNVHRLLPHLLGGSFNTQITRDHTTLTSATISGTGVTVTFAGGSVLTDGVVAGSFFKLATMSVAGNNGVWVPILNISPNGRVLTVPSGYLVDNVVDAAFSITFARRVYTATPFEDSYNTVELNFPDLDRSMLGEAMRFNAFQIALNADQVPNFSFGAGGRDLVPQASGASPYFTDVVTGLDTGDTGGSQSNLVLLDGGLFVNGSRVVDFTAFSVGATAPVSTTPVAGTRRSPNVSLGMFDYTGEYAAVMEALDNYDAFDAETQISILAHYAESNAPGANFIGVYAGNGSFGGHSAPIGGDNAIIESLPLWMGEDRRGTGFAPSTLVISDSLVLA